MYHVTLAVFSGMPDPEWTVPANQIKGLLAGAKTYHPADMPARLGYKGFVLQNGNTARLVVRAETKKLQLQLLQTMPKDVVQLLQGDLIKLIKKEINTGAVKAEIDSQISKRRNLLMNPANGKNEISVEEFATTVTTMQSTRQPIIMLSLVFETGIILIHVIKHGLAPLL